MSGKAMLNEKTKTILSFMFRFGVSIGLLMFIFSKIDLTQTAEVLKSADLLYITFAVIAFLIVNVILLFRWFIFIRALDLSATTKNVIMNYFYGLFGNLFLPTAIGGDLLKAVGLCKNSTQKPRVVASILLDRLSGFASIVIIATLAFVFGYSYINDNTLIIPIVLMGVGAVTIATILMNETAYSFFCQAFNRFPRFKNSLITMHYDIALLKESHKSKEGGKAILVSCVAQSIFILSYYFIAKALHQDIALIYFFIFIPIISVISSFPSIGGLGVREIGAVYLFGKIGLESGIAVSLTLINFLFVIAIGLIGGALYVYTLSTGRVQHYTPDAGVEAGQA